LEVHGNAGTIAQGWRTDTYRALSAGAAHRIFILTADYRGFGNSTGNPTENGLIADGIALVDWALNVAHIPPHRIVIVGQSLGTAVATAVADHYISDIETRRKEFAGILLVAAFSDIPTLMGTYAIGYLIPILSPLRLIPRLQSCFARRIRDSWNTVSRLENIVRQSERLNLVLIHAKNDWDIPWKHSNTLFNAAVTATGQSGSSSHLVENLDLGRQGYSKTVTLRVGEPRSKRIQQIILNDGGEHKNVSQLSSLFDDDCRAQPTDDICSNHESSA
jgi:abhydrolase domain-containing protein 12